LHEQLTNTHCFWCTIKMKRVAGLALTSVVATQSGTNDRTITKVVKLLQQMLQTSKQEGKADRKTFGEYKCYCDDNELDKTDEITTATKIIQLSESEIETLQGSTGKLSSECAKLEAQMAANVASRQGAQDIRDAEAADFAKVEQDLTDSEALVTQAIAAFAAVGADQTLAAARDHDKFLAGGPPTLLSVKSEAIRNVLRATSALVSPQQSKVLLAFVQSPGAGFTGNYAAQSGEVVGILKNMKDTFKRELSTAQKVEKDAIEAHGEFEATKIKEHAEFVSLFDEKQVTLGTNDDALTAAKTALTANEQLKKDSDTFLTKLLKDCKQTNQEYTRRNEARAAEQAALAEAVSILNSDAAFATFGTVTATSQTASFLQLKKISKHQPQLLDRIESLLAKTSSVRVQKVASLVKSGNPFATVLNAIREMLVLNGEEGKLDVENRDWCRGENTMNTNNLATATGNNESLTTQIETLHNHIQNTLLQTIADTEASLRLNVKNQKETTKMKVEATHNYEVDIKNLQETRALLAKATKVLKAYYDKVESDWSKDTGEAALNHQAQSRWNQFTRDQSSQSGTEGNIFFQLNLISTESLTEEQTSHDDEIAAQHSYEDAMQGFVDAQNNLRTVLADTQNEMAEKTVEKLEKEKEKMTEEERIVAIKAYQAEILPGCNFIQSNFDTRKANRETEATALGECVTLIQGTDTYQLAVASAHKDSLGDCKDICVPNEAHAKCKACLASVTVAGYCAGHTADGCPGQ